MKNFEFCCWASVSPPTITIATSCFAQRSANSPETTLAPSCFADESRELARWYQTEYFTNIQRHGFDR